MLQRRIGQFIGDPSAGDFDSLALEAFAYQFERIEPFRRLCESQGAVPGQLDNWREIPAVPALAFKTLKLAAAAAVEVFRSSGTTGTDRSVHHHPFPDLYQITIDASFPGACLVGLETPPMLSLVPDRQQAPDSSLSFMIDHVLAAWGAPDSVTALGPQGLKAAAARSFCGARQRDRRPALILATAFALVELLEALERYDLRFRLPAGSVIFETGGYKGRTREVLRDELLARLDERLGVTAERVVGEYGMTELTSQLYTQVLAGGEPGIFIPPHWMRARVLDPESLEELPPGRPGLVALFDLANLGSAVHLLTQDLGVVSGAGLELVGRAAGAELRGCSLAVEELRGG